MPSTAPLYNGAPQPFSKLYFSLTGTSTPANTYTTPDLSVANSNPLVADSTGIFSPAYLDPSLGRYRVSWKTSADVQLLPAIDNVLSEQNTSQSYTVSAPAPTIDLIQTGGGVTANNGAWRIKAANEQLVIYAMNDAKNVLVPILTVDRTGTTVDSINLTATAIQIAGTALTSSGNFTPGFTGFSANPSANTAQYAITGNHVALQLSFVTGTSNATTFTITGLPAAIRPVRKQVLRFPGLVDNGTTLNTGQAVINTDGTITLYPSDTSTTWTNSGNKGGTGAGPAYTTLVYPIA